MIKKEAYTIEWLEAKVKELDAASYDLAEKMMYAFTLLEQLKKEGLEFIFKGGTALVLMVDEFHRFSKDIDIIIHKKPDNLHEIFDKLVSQTIFIRWEESERKNDEFNVPKEHYKFYYNESKPSKFPEKPILLDIIFVENTYPETTNIKVDHAFIPTEEPYIDIVIPTFNSLMGDKLTAFAPNTIGIPIGKNKEVEIAKQLFDLNLLYNKIDSFQHVADAFKNTAQMCIENYQRNFTISQVYDDIINTSLTLAMMGKLNEPVYLEIKNGINALSQYLSKKSKFNFNTAILASSKIAYLSACLKNNKKPEILEWQKVSPDDFKTRKIENEKYSSLNKQLKAGYPEAWYYWLNTVEVLESAEKEEIPEMIAVVAIAEKKYEEKEEKTERRNNLLHLVFIVNGKETLVENVNPNATLKSLVERALEQTGNSGRPIEEWLVKWNNVDLDINRKVGEFHFPPDVKIFLSVKSGVGG